MPPDLRLDGSFESRFQPVADAFRANFTAGKECGASLAVIQEGRLVLDLWGGYADSIHSRLWERDTLVNVFSTTKLVTALCVLLLVERSEIDLEAPLCRYWPEYTSHGKDRILVRHVLSHTAGVPAFTPCVTFDDIFDWGKITHILEAEKPWWQPGTRLGYHTLTYGFLLGEIVRRVTGKTLGQFLHDEITAPLGIDFYIGLPEQDEKRVAEIVPERQALTPFQLALVKFLFPAAMKIAANPPLDGRLFNSRACHAAEIPAGNGIGNARSVAQLGSILANGGSFNGRQVLSGAMVARAITVQARGRDAIAFGRQSAWGLGVMLLNKDLLLSPRSFYATGLGGSVCVMDIERKLTLAYVMNKMAEYAEGDARSIPLVQKLWDCLS
jgi:CubicO group peptidase (beta-lactamase class C family)